MDWKMLAITIPILFVTYQSLSKFFPKTLSIFLVNAYASFVGLIIMLILHLLFSSNKSLMLNTKYIPLAIGIGILISFGNFGIIKAYNLGAPQAFFTPIFYIALIIYGTIFGLLFWHEQLNIPQIIGTVLAIIGVIIVFYFKK